MTRKKIELEKGGIQPISRGLWFSAAEKLSEAEGAIAAMRGAANRIDYEAGWTCFSDSIEEFWTRFIDEGKTAFTGFQPWAGNIISKRKSDELLTYLYQARHQSQHGRISMQWAEQKLLIAPNFNGHIRGLKVYPDGTYEIDATPLHPSLPDAPIVHSPGEPILPQIENKKHGQTFPAPKTFAGTPLQDTSPLGVANEGLVFYRRVLEEAYAKFVTATLPRPESDAQSIIPPDLAHNAPQSW